MLTEFSSKQGDSIRAEMQQRLNLKADLEAIQQIIAVSISKQDLQQRDDEINLLK